MTHTSHPPMTPEQEELLSLNIGKLIVEIRKQFRFGYLTFYLNPASLTFRWTVFRIPEGKYKQEVTFEFSNYNLKAPDIRAEVDQLYKHFFSKLPIELKTPPVNTKITSKKQKDL